MKKFKKLFLFLFICLSFAFSICFTCSADSNIQKTLRGNYEIDLEGMYDYLCDNAAYFEDRYGKHMQIEFQFATLIQYQTNQVEGTNLYNVGIEFNTEDLTLSYYNAANVHTYLDNLDNLCYKNIYCYTNQFIYISDFIYIINRFFSESTVIGGYYMVHNNGHQFTVDFNSLAETLSNAFDEVSARGFDGFITLDLNGTVVNGIKYNDKLYYTFKGFKISLDYCQLYLVFYDDTEIPLLSQEYANGTFYLFFNYHQGISSFLADWLSDNGDFSVEPFREQTLDYSIDDLANTVVSIPVKYLSSFLSFELFGKSMFVIVTSLLTIFMVIWVVKKFV